MENRAGGIGEVRNRIIQENLRAKQLADAISSEPITTDEVHIVPPPKRPKLNIPVVELEWRVFLFDFFLTKNFWSEHQFVRRCILIQNLIWL